MGFTSAVEISAIYLQFLSITYSLYTNWSINWRWYINFVLFWKFELPNVDVYGFRFDDIRVHYIVVTAMVPYATALFIQTVFQKKLKLLFIILFQLFMSLFVAGVAMSALSNYDSREDVKSLKGASNGLIAAGVIAMSIYGLVGGATKLKKRKQEKVTAGKDMGETGERQTVKTTELGSNAPQTLKQKKLKVFMILLITILFFSFKLAALAYISLLLFVIYLVLNVSSSGREQLHKVSIVVRKASLKFLLFVLGLLYIPITTAVFEMIVCKEVSCPKGQMLKKPRYFDNMHIQSDTSAGRESGVSSISSEYITLQNICEVCDFGPNSLSLCPGESQSVLGANNLISCKYDIASYYLPSAIFFILIVSIGIPLLYYKIVKDVTISVCNDAIEAKLEEKWFQDKEKSENSAKSMYSGFKLKWRYMEVILMAYRALVLVIFIIFSSIDLDIVSAVLISLVHSGALVFTLKNRPYYSRSDLFLLIATISSNLLNSIFLIGVNSTTSEVSAVFAYLLIVPNVIFPAAAYAYGRYLDKKEEKTIEKFEVDVVKDDQTNSSLINLILNYMAILSVICVPAFFLFILSIVYEPSATAGLQVDTRGVLDLKTSELGSFKTVDEFMTNCECLPNRSSKELGTEIWVCQNNSEFRYKVL